MGSVMSSSKKPDETTNNDDVIKNYVKELLKHKSINNVLIPDVLEERLYEDIFSVLIAHLKKILSETKIELLDHEIRFIITPKKEEVP
jgi:hypothetical protein